MTRYDGKLVEAVSSLGALLNDAGIPTRVSTPGAALEVSPATERALVATAIEAATNIFKHAPGSTSAAIEVRGCADVVELVVTNLTAVARAAKTDHRGGRGLARSRQRLAEHAGRLESNGVSGGRTLRATVPTAGSRVARVTSSEAVLAGSAN